MFRTICGYYHIRFFVKNFVFDNVRKADDTEPEPEPLEPCSDRKQEPEP